MYDTTKCISVTNDESIGDFVAKHFGESNLYESIDDEEEHAQCFSLDLQFTQIFRYAPMHEKCDGTILQMVRNKDAMIQRK